MFNNLKLFVVAAVATVWVMGVAPAMGQDNGKTPQTSQIPVDTATYRLKPDDTIDVIVMDVQDASGEMTIRRDGYITLPFGIGDVKVVGLTTQECAALIAKKLKTQVIDPKVTVILKSQSANRFYMMGAVKQQGIFDVKPQWRLTEAIAAAGGLEAPPERSRAVIWRLGRDHQTVDLKDLLIKGVDADNIEIQPGDVINVMTDTSVRVQVVGQVKKAGITEVLEGQGVAEVLSSVGGVDPEARLSKCKLVRAGKEIPVDLYNIVVLGHPENNMVVQENDTLYVPQNQDRVSVYGAVGKPGPLLLQDGRQTTLTDAISLAGGFTSGALRSGVTIARRGPDGKWVNTNYDVQKMLKVNKGKAAAKPAPGAKPIDDPLLQDEDIIYVAESGKPNKGDLGIIFGLINFGRFFGLP